MTPAAITADEQELAERTKRVKQYIADEITETEKRLKRYREQVKETERKYIALGKEADKVLRPKSKKEKPVTPADDKVLQQWQLAGHQYRTMLASVTRTERIIAKLKSPEELERRLHGARTSQPRRAPAATPRTRASSAPRAAAASATGRSTTRMAAAEKKPSDAKAAAIKACLAALKENKNDVEKTAAALTKAKTPMMNGKIGPWNARRVRWVASQGGVDLAAAPKKAATPLKDREPEAVARTETPKKNGGSVAAAAKKVTSTATGEARPLSKSAQAAGTSRGGTGTKKAQAQAASPKRQTAKISNAKRTTAKRTGAKTSSAKRTTAKRTSAARKNK